ncbi:MAG: peptide chain release factor N(5)-glutamine methyltransferase [Gammaproteobacteria bacterium]|nr:peptide chain release factor N(5)-glutamine methyltransferase [Gammaproteobacteria bacterium]
MTNVEQTPTIRELLRAGTRALIRADGGRLDAELLLGVALACDRTTLIREHDAPVEAASAARFHTLLEARAQGRPLAYLRGVQEFWSLDFEVTPDVLIPRGDSELLVHLALRKMTQKEAPHAADLGTGSGALAIAIAKERADSTVLAVDRSAAALRVARRNAVRHRVTNARWVQADWVAALKPRTYAVIVANPPYVASDDPLLANSSLRFEPRTALAAGNDGLAALTALAHAAPTALLPGGWLLMEHGAAQGAAVRALYAAVNLTEIATLPDLAGHERVTVGRRAET